MLSLQQIFDQSATHLLTQRARSMLDFGHGESCAYRGANGRMCAAGPFIPDTEYEAAFEGFSVCLLDMTGELPEKKSRMARLLNAFKKGGVDLTRDETSTLLAKIQRLHDLANVGGDFATRELDENPDLLVAHWRRGFDEIAQEFDLDPAVLSRLQ